MQNQQWPRPPSHNTFQFGSITIDSSFDSGNCSNAQKVNGSTFNIWIATDHPHNNYRTWFHFSVGGYSKGMVISFNVKNMQNQSRLLLEGLVPVFREQSSNEWKRIKERVNTAGIQYNEGWIEWQFRHTFTSNEKVFLAFFYPWSLTDNQQFLEETQKKLQNRPNIYYHRTTIIHSIEGRPIQLITLSSTKSIVNKDQKIQDNHLFSKNQKPKNFKDKKGLVITARVHPGQIPGSHVLVGIIKFLTEQTEMAKLLLDQFVFYIFPFLNPDGVYRGHYRTDTKGINLNRYYINPSPTNHSSIYAVKKLIMHLHVNGRFYGFLDLHAHAGRKGMFIYGNSMNQLDKQVDTCIFPKILSLNSEDFQYEGSNFTQKNMYCKDRADQVSKEGSGRVAIYKATKNANCWTLECNYNTSRTLNILEPQKKIDDQDVKASQLNKQIIINFKVPQQKESKGFYTIETYHRLGKEICQSFLDLIQKNPMSRIDNPKNYFQSVENLKLNLAVALMRMAPSRFQACFKKIYYSLTGDNEQLIMRSLKALKLILIKKAKIENISSYIKDKKDDTVVFPNLPKTTRKVQSLGFKDSMVTKNIRITKHSAKISKQSMIDDKNPPDDAASIQSVTDSQEILQDKVEEKVGKKIQDKEQQKIEEKFTKLNVSKVILQMEDFKMIGIQTLRNSVDPRIVSKHSIKMYMQTNNSRKNIRFKLQEIPGVTRVAKPSLSIASIANLSLEPKLIKGISAREPIIEF